MKTKTTKGMMLLVMLIAVKCSIAQNVLSSQGVNSTTLPSTPAPEALRVQNGLISHFEAGTFGGLSSSDQWLGLGPAYISSTFDPSIYGLRIQRNGQGLVMNIVGSNLDSRIAWGGQNGNPILQKGFLFGTNGASFKETFRHTKNNSGSNYWGDSYASNGLLGHYVNGTFGNFGSTDQWMGLGQPYNPSTGTAITSIYGLRTQ